MAESRAFARPRPDESPPFYRNYVALVPDDGKLLTHLQQGAVVMETLVRSLPAAKLAMPHTAGEWTVGDILQHLIDAERIFCFRALCIGRNDKTDIPSFDEHAYAETAAAATRQIDDLLTEYAAVRQVTLSLVRSLSDKALARIGSVDGSPFSARVAVHCIAGHERWHLQSLRENYG